MKNMVILVGGNFRDTHGITVEIGQVVSNKDDLGYFLVATPRGVAVSHDREDGYMKTTNMGPWEGFGSDHSINLLNRFKVVAEATGEFVADGIKDEDSLKDALGKAKFKLESYK